VAELKKLRPALGSRVYSILGNHDCLETVLHFPDLDIHPLLNEAVWLERGGDRILLAGIDDSHWYGTQDFTSFRSRIREAPVSLLLAHSPEIFREAEAEGFDLMLCGHTHGGQICLPGGFPLVTHTRNTPRSFTAGAWSWKRMRGYTTRGAGTSTLDCRFFCPGEITVHILRRPEKHP
jgi:predicted MPP superfamily phosphohydrolase